MTPIKLKVKILHVYPEICRHYSIRKMVKDHRFFLISKIVVLENYLKEQCKYMNMPNLESLDCRFIPSRTAMNGLNFVTAEDEDKIKTEKLHDVNIVDIVKLLYILLREKYENIDSENLMINLIQNILPKYKIEDISKVFF